MAAATTTKANGKSTAARSKPKENGSSQVPHAADDLSKHPASAPKPDKAAYDAEQNRLKNEIDVLQKSLNAIKDKIALTSKDGPGTDRRKELRAELDSLRDQQATGKNAKGKILDQVRALEDGISKKIKDLQAAKAKHPFKTTVEVDAHIKKLEAQIDSGTMKLADEKRALAEVSQAKRSKRLVENFDADQKSIDEDRAKVAELRSQMDDPKVKAASERFDAVKKELDELRKEGDEAFANRNKLFDERNELKTKIDDLYAQKKQSSQNYKDANDKHWAKVHEDRAKRAERYRLQKEAEELEKRKLKAEQIREEASVPAFQSQIEDCQTLIDWFTGVSGGAPLDAAPMSSTKSSVAGVPKLELRQVDTEPMSGMVVRKKKGEGDEDYFVGGGGKKKGKPNNAASSGTQTPPTNTSKDFNLPLGKLTALLGMSIPVPSSLADVPRVIEDLRTKKAWFEANQERVTAENIGKAERDIQRLTQSNSVPTDEAAAEEAPSGASGDTAEPPSTADAVVADEPSAVPSSDDKVEAIAEIAQE